MTRRSRAGATGALLALLLLLPVAAAHRDLALHDGTVRLGAGEALPLEGALHYHRLVGGVRAVDVPEAALSVSIEGPEGTRLVARGQGDLPVNALVACCKGEAYTAHVVRVTNDGPAAVDVHVRLVALHDGIAVAGDDAETGAMASMVAFFGVTAFVLARRLPTPPTRPLRGSVGRWAGAALGLHLLMWAVSAALALPAMARYGGGPVAGTVAATADLPWTANPILNTQSLVQLAVIAMWIGSAIAWATAARHARHARHGPHVRMVGLVGVLLGVGALAACAAWAWEYDRLLGPALVGLASAALPIGGGAWVMRDARTG